MTSITYGTGETHILQQYFQGGADFGPFYIGLGTHGAPLNEYATLSDVVAREIADAGYSRKSVDRSNDVYGWEVRGDMAQSPQLTFTNTHPSEIWRPIDFAFLTLSPQGTLGDSLLIAAADLPQSIILAPGQSMDLIFRFRQTSVLDNGPRMNQGNAQAVIVTSGVADGTVA